jgi:uncharacterized membrane protein YdjX (TVP38/TMEM64 family)
MRGRLTIGARWAGVACFAAAFALLLFTLPLDGLMDALQAWIQGLGFWAPLAFAVTYGIAATLFVPGSALSLAAGVLFGVWLGTAVVWLGATLAIVLAFLIARYAARARVEAIARTRPRFAAVDRAIGEQGWKIVALMRLSPVFPFNLQNYLFGVTAIRFWPCCIASSAFILPGTFLYVYLGFAGGEAAAAVGGSGNTDAWKLALQLVGLLATLVVTIYIARLAAKAVAKHAPGKGEIRAEVAKEPVSAGSHARVAWTLALGVACLVASLTAFARREAIRSFFLPPRVELIERYARGADSASFDHAAFDALLRAHVNDYGLVDYAALAADGGRLAGYIDALGTAPFVDLGRNEKLALLINAYNAFTLQLIVEHYPLDSIYEIPAGDRWESARWMVADRRYSLDEIENSLIRPNFRDDRIHFALVCAALGCPKLRREAYTGEAIEEQLEQQARDTHASERWFRYDEAEGLVRLTQVYSWYAEDFEQLHGSVLASAARYSSALRQALEEGRALRIRWLPYDWSLNGKPRTARTLPPT